MPKDRRPREWHGKYFNTVVPQILNFYGHPEAGQIWEEDFENITFEVGFDPMDNHRACYWHPGLRVFMVIHVCDIKMAGPEAGSTTAWKC